MDIKTLLPALKKLVTDLSEDLLQRSIAQPKVDAGLREAYTQIEKGGRTADAFEVWREDYLDQVAVAWVLGCVFVRFMEDNHLIDECWLAGDGAELAGGTNRRKLAEDTHELYFRAHPHESDREYFEHVFHEVGKIPACRDLFAEWKTPLWAVGPSGDAAMKLLAFWREVVPETGALKRSFNHEIHETHESKTGDSFGVFGVFRGFSPDSDSTRFLGDLYQDLSERARKKYALLQTPVFVEEFILDRTLNPAIDEFGIDEVRMIDPTCGSGHFLLGGFARLFDLWIKREDNEVVAAQKALDGVWGVDINPFAVAIARFRLIVAALRSCGIKRLKSAPAWNIHLTSGDSLLFGSKPSFNGERSGITQQLNLFEIPAIFAVEDRKSLQQILGQGYHVVVGNPPYITAKDKAQNQAYRQLYSTCHRKFSLSVPFAQRFWELALQQRECKNGCGYIGQITANSFMKREFGKKLIEDFFPKIDLTHVIDMSGAYIPGHGTPTVILFGRSSKPVGETVRAVLGIKGEPSTPEDPSQGVVWQSIVNQIDTAGMEDGYTSTTDVPRTTFNSHPWSIGGGGAAELKERIGESTSIVLGAIASSIGFGAILGEDDAFGFPKECRSRVQVVGEFVRPVVEGDQVREWEIDWSTEAIFPYDNQIALVNDASVLHYLWPYRSVLENRADFSKRTYAEAGRPHWEYHQIPQDKFGSPLSIVFGEVATHNHFALDRGGKVFKQTAPIIKLSPDANEDDHLALLGLLNSSTACFWLKQVCFPKGGDHVGTEGARVRRSLWDERFAFSSTPVGKLPISESKPLAFSRSLDEAASQLTQYRMSSVLDRWDEDEEELSKSILESEKRTGQLRSEMMALQEELDWKCYQYYGLLSDDLCYHGDDRPGIEFGQRAFEIVMARRMVKGDFTTSWFERHSCKPITEVPSGWPEEYQQLLERRIKRADSRSVGNC